MACSLEKLIVLLLAVSMNPTEGLTNENYTVVREDNSSTEDIEWLKLKLLEAASKGDLTTMETVVQSVCNDLIECPSMTTLLRQRDASGNTALHLAVTSGSAEAVKFLLQYGVLADTREYNLKTLLNMTCIAAHVDIVENLVLPLKKQTVNLRDSFGNTALTLAVDAGYLDVIKILAPFSDTDSLGDNVASAAEKGNIKIFIAMLESGECIEPKKLLKALAIFWENFLIAYMTLLMKEEE